LNLILAGLSCLLPGLRLEKFWRLAMSVLPATPNWTPLEAKGWRRRAIDDRIVCESEGGTLMATLVGIIPGTQVYLHVEVSGRFLIRVNCNGILMCEDLVTNDEFDHFIDVTRFAAADALQMELHLVPATSGHIRVAQAVHICPPMERKTLQANLSRLQQMTSER
jgi:hypothetical protein